MLGNDVVDLGDPECREARLHPRFDARVFTPEERTALRGSDAPARLPQILAVGSGVLCQRIDYPAASDAA